jgi:hypothetical protein
MNQYEEHLAHSAPCSSRWDGYDRGDQMVDEVHESVIGRMTSVTGRKVVITLATIGYDDWYTVTVDDMTVYCDQGRDKAIETARSWMN